MLGPTEQFTKLGRKRYWSMVIPMCYSMSLASVAFAGGVVIVSICSVLEGECWRSFSIQTEGGTRRPHRSAGGGVQTPDAPGCDRDPSSRICSRNSHSSQAQMIS